MQAVYGSRESRNRDVSRTLTSEKEPGAMKFSAMLSTATVAISLAMPAEAVITVYTANLSGPAESPPVASPGTGFASVQYDSTLHTFLINASWSDLLAGTTVAHIHCCTT